MFFYFFLMVHPQISVSQEYHWLIHIRDVGFRCCCLCLNSHCRNLLLEKHIFSHSKRDKIPGFFTSIHHRNLKWVTNNKQITTRKQNKKRILLNAIDTRWESRMPGWSRLSRWHCWSGEHWSRLRKVIFCHSNTHSHSF